MDVSKAFSIQTDYKDRRFSPSWDIVQFIDVIFIDKTNSATDAYVYQLNKSVQLSEVNFFLNNGSSWKDSCTLLGELSELDKKSKLIHMTNKRSISFKHLIVINGKKPLVSTINHEITHALQALMDALKVNPNINSLLLSSKSMKKNFNEPTATENISDNSKHVFKATHSYFSEHEHHKVTFELDAINERLYEIYI